VDWVSGAVKVVPYDGDEIKFSEEAPASIKEEERMRYRVSGGSTLKIHFCADNYVSFDSLNKVLTLQVPKSYAGAFDLDNVSSQVDISGLTLTDLEVDSVSGRINLSGISATEADICTVSGPVEAVGCSFVRSDADTTSGNLKLRGSFTECKLNSVSGELLLESSICPAAIDMDTISGRAIISIPENDGFTVKQDSVSGDLDCDFDVQMSNNRFVHKNGAADFSVNSVSGSLSIQKYEPAA
ncbi:MAG: DUF4097 family beta strand repeat-containing protein, partial [Eubacteriales bacterium]|nr:DUF4097 family beta strand repeat-containing protein [Eubacteriales bacterium]